MPFMDPSPVTPDNMHMRAASLAAYFSEMRPQCDVRIDPFNDFVQVEMDGKKVVVADKDTLSSLFRDAGKRPDFLTLDDIVRGENWDD